MNRTNHLQKSSSAINSILIISNTLSPELHENIMCCSNLHIIQLEINVAKTEFLKEVLVLTWQQMLRVFFCIFSTVWQSTKLDFVMGTDTLCQFSSTSLSLWNRKKIRNNKTINHLYFSFMDTTYCKLSSRNENIQKQSLIVITP